MAKGMEFLDRLILKGNLFTSDVAYNGPNFYTTSIPSWLRLSDRYSSLPLIDQ